MAHRYEWRGDHKFFEIYRIMSSSEEDGGGETLVRRVYNLAEPLGFEASQAERRRPLKEGEKRGNVYVVMDLGEGNQPAVPTNTFYAHGPDGLFPSQVVDQLTGILDAELQKRYRKASKTATETVIRRQPSSEEAA